MDDKKIIISSLAMDLKRVALALNRNSLNVANIFRQEVLKELDELEKLEIPQYLQRALLNSRKSLLSNTERTAEDALMYSTLFQNFALKKLS